MTGRPSLAALALLLGGGLASAAPGQEFLDDAVAWRLFTDHCGKITGNPGLATLQAMFGVGSGTMAYTEDGWGVAGTIGLEDYEGSDVTRVFIQFGTDRFAEGSTVYCTMQVVLAEDDTQTRLLDFASSHAKDLLGPDVIRVGGAMKGNIGTGPGLPATGARMTLFHVAGFPPPHSLRVAEFPRHVSLTLFRLVEAGQAE